MPLNTRADIQAALDAAPSNSALPDGTLKGIVVDLPNEDIALDGTLHLEPGHHLRGGFGTYLHITNGPCVDFYSSAGFHYASTASVGQMNLESTNGDAIGINANVAAESARLRVYDCGIRAGRHAINLTNPNGDALTYFPRIERTRVYACGNMGILACANNIFIDDFQMVNVHRTGSYPTEAYIKIYGVGGGGAGGMIQNSWVEGKRGCPMVWLKDGWYVWKNNHNETNQGVNGVSGDAVNYPAVASQINVDNAVLEADTLYFVSPITPVKLLNNGKLFVSRQLIAEDGNGFPAPVRNCYLTDGNAGNQLVYGGHSFIGAQIAPVATIPVRR